MLVDFEDRNMPGSRHYIEKISSSGTHTVALSCLIFTDTPTTYPTVSPTSNPTLLPTSNPTYQPTSDPTVEPTIFPTISPTEVSSRILIFQFYVCLWFEGYIVYETLSLICSFL